MKSSTRPKPTAAAEPAPMSHDDVRAILRSAAADLRAIIGKLEPITNGGLPPIPTGAYEADGSDESLMAYGEMPESLDYHFRTAILPSDLKTSDASEPGCAEYCLEEIALHWEDMAAATAEKLERVWRERVRREFVAGHRSAPAGSAAA